MTDTPNDQHHSIEELWKAQNQSQSKMTEISSDLAGLKSNVSAISSSLRDLINIVQSSQTPKPFRWEALIAGIVLLGTYVALVVLPAQQKAEANTRKIERIDERMYNEAIENARLIERNKTLLERQ